MPRRPPALALAAAALLAASACGQRRPGPKAGDDALLGALGRPNAALVGRRVEVREADFSISTPSVRLAPGTYTFRARNGGPSWHDLAIRGPGVWHRATAEFGPGETRTLTATLRRGRYLVYCSVPGHRAAGMALTIRVGSVTGRRRDHPERDHPREEGRHRRAEPPRVERHHGGDDHGGRHDGHGGDRGRDHGGGHGED